jgi:hypothetical protein
VELGDDAPYTMTEMGSISFHMPSEIAMKIVVEFLPDVCERVAFVG